MKRFLLYLWQIPQNLIGLFLTLFYKCDSKISYKDKTIRVCPGFPGGISLGEYVFVKRYPVDKHSKNKVRHEYGHTRQSLYLGPLYLIVVGLPSLLWAIFYKYDINNPNGYYRFYTESWADRLGGTSR